MATTNGVDEIAQMRGLLEGQAAQIAELMNEIRSRAASTGGLIDTKLLTKPNTFAGEGDGKDSWMNWSFKMKAYFAAMNPRMSVLLEAASAQGDEILHDTMGEQDIQYSTSLYYVLSLLTDGEALDIVRNSPTNNGLEVWRRMVMRWEPKVPSRFRGMLQGVLFPRWDSSGDTMQLITAWEKSVQDYEVQSQDKVSDAIKMGVLLHHLPDTSLREHLLLNSRCQRRFAASPQPRRLGADHRRWT